MILRSYGPGCLLGFFLNTLQVGYPFGLLLHLSSIFQEPIFDRSSSLLKSSHLQPEDETTSRAYLGLLLLS